MCSRHQPPGSSADSWLPLPPLILAAMSILATAIRLAVADDRPTDWAMASLLQPIRILHHSFVWPSAPPPHRLLPTFFQHREKKNT